MTEDFNYYSLRLREIFRIYREVGRDDLDRNLFTIKKIIEEYKKFKSHPEYDETLVGIVETFVLN